MVLWASCYPLITIGLESAPHLTFAVLRAVIAGLTLVGCAALLRQPLPRDGATWGWISLAGFGMTGLGYYGMFHAAEFVAPGLATVIANSQPLIAAVLAFLFLKERLSARGWIGLGIGFLGIAVIAAPQIMDGDQSSSFEGLVYVLLAASGVAVGNIAIKKLSKKTDAAVAMGLQLLIGAVPLALIASSTESAATIDWSPLFIASLIGLSIPGTAVAFWLWQYTLGKIELTNANVFSFLVPVFGLTIGVAFFSERVTLLMVLGTAIATAGVMLTTARPPKPPPSSGNAGEGAFHRPSTVSGERDQGGQ